MENKLRDFFETEGFNVNLFEQNNEQCAEIEKWTEGGVDMIIYLVPFTVEQFTEYVKDFEVDDEIDHHREMKDYKDNFTIAESLEDFTNFHNSLKDTLDKLEKEFDA